MHSGCQSVLQHRLLPGNTAGSYDHVRYSLSFRKHNPSSDFTAAGPSSSPVLINSPLKSPVRCTPATLLLGDSFFARLDESKLGKSKKVVLNSAKGGNKIPDVLLTIDDFCNNDNNHQYVIDQVYVSVGTNDIRYCRNGVSYLKGELFSLLRKIKLNFPNSPGPFIHFYKKKVSFDFAIALCSIGAPDIPKKFCSAIQDGEHGFLSHAHFYHVKIDKFCLKWCKKTNMHLGGFRMVQLVRVESAEDFNQNGNQYYRLFN